MNGAARRRGGSAGGAAGQRPNGFAPAPAPTGKVLVEGYRKDVLGGFDRERPRYDSPSEIRPPPNSSPVDLKDPIQVHLLTETALGDSKTFEILSQEEVDDLKKQIQSLSTRIEQARANLAIQSKYRDAAISMARLYSPSKADGKRRSLLGSNNNNRMSDSAKEAEMEKQASERRCEELATELFSLEKRLMEPQRRLLQHTAGILQMTHRASAAKNKPGQPPLGPGPMMNGIPGSPESLYTYTNTRNSMEIPADDFDPTFDKSLYLPLDQPDRPTTATTARPRKNTIEIPMKSPIREQNAQLRELREELDRAKDEASQLRSELTQTQDERARLATSEEQLRAEQAAARDEVARLQAQLDENARAVAEQTSRAADEAGRFRDADARMRAIETQMGAETEALRKESAARGVIIAEMEAGLEKLSRRLREVVVGWNPERGGGFGEPPGKGAGEGESLRGQMEYLERVLDAVVEEQKVQAAEASRAADEARAEASAASAEAAAIGSSLGQLESSLDQAGVRVQSLARQVHAVLQQSNADQQPPPEGTLDDQLDYLEDALRCVGSELSRALEASSSASAKKKNIDQVDAVLMGLWEIIQSGYAEIEQQRAARRQNRAMGQGGDDDEDDLSSNEFEGMTNEPYSLQAFSTKVQWLYAQATGLREQKYILQRQIKQQRELNNRSESEKDREIQARADELQQTQQLLDAAERAAADAQAQLQRVLADMDTLQKTTAANEAASVSSTKAVQDQLKDRSARIAALESEVRDAQTRLATAESSLANTQSSLAASASTLTTREAEISTLQSQLTAATASAQTSTEQLTALQASLADKEAELDRMNTMVIELKTELTFAKAELDGAYGSRKQRAAEAAAALSSTGNAQSGEQVARLRAELENTLHDLEEITRESIAAERERLDMEGRLDEAVSVRGELEAEVKGLRERLARVQEELDGERLKAPGGGSGGGGVSGGAGARSGAGASMLSEQFRGVMKEERRKFQEEMKEEQARRRKVEEELRALKRGQGAGALSTRGALSPR